MNKKQDNYVYHSSKSHNLTTLSPNISTHGESWVYATTTLEMSAVFLSPTGGDLTCQVGRDSETSKVFICERFKGAFEHRYAGKSGSIYLLPAENFKPEDTGWSEEVICEDAVDIIEEIKIENIQAYLLDLIDQGKIILIKYPQKFGKIPEDDEDLVFRGITWSRNFGDDILKQFKMYHPHLMERIQQGLDEGKYLP